MKIMLKGADREYMDELIQTQASNERMLRLTSAYLVRRARWVTASDVDQVTACGVTEEQAYCALMSAGMGLDEQDAPEDRRLAMNYLWPSVRQLDAEEYRRDPYFRTVSVPEITEGKWSLGRKEYAPYEAFVRDDIRLYEDFREVPRIGFFSESFRFPAVMENGNEWMTVTPNEVETMKEPIRQAEGRVAAFGLGLGYFPFMASGKESVKKVTVIEKDENVISLFREHILPQFPHRDKIEIVCADAFEFAEHEMREGRFDCAFVDLWHDVSDGVPMYLKMKKLEKLHPETKFSYWIEDSLLSNIRFHLFWCLMDACAGMETDSLDRLLDIREIREFREIRRILTDREYLRSLAARLQSSWPLHQYRKGTLPEASGHWMRIFFCP